MVMRWPPRAARRPSVRLSARLRLTLLYGGLFLAAGCLLLAVNFVLFEQGLENRRPHAWPVAPDEPVQRTPDPAPQLPGGEAPPVAPQQALRQLLLDPDLDFTAEQREELTAVLERISVTSEERSQVQAQVAELQRRWREQALANLLSRSGIALAVMAVIAVALGWMVAGRVLRPLRDITATARRLSGANLHERINMRGPDDELKELADTIDQMLHRLDAAFASQRRFVANASHELRTPLTIVRTEVDVALATRAVTPEQFHATAKRVRDATERSQRLIDSLLLLARSERRPDVHEPVDLAGAADEALDAVGPERRARGLRVEATLEPAVVSGDRPLLERLVANLVENAVRHNLEGGWLRVETGTTRGAVYVLVANGGEAINPAEVADLFQPFRRRAAPRTGSDRGAGLGLSIVRAVTETHGGHLQADPLADGGLQVRVTLPAHRPTAQPRAAGAAKLELTTRRTAS